MQWDEIIKGYPDNIEKIQRARDIQQRIAAQIKGVNIPRLEGILSKEEILKIIPVTPLAKICSEVWQEIFKEEPSFDMEQVIRISISDENAQEVLTSHNDAVSMMVRSVLTLYFNSLREYNSALIPADWSAGDCPFCHTNPRIAFDAESERRLYCPLCGQDWIFPRVKCPYCGNHDHKTLGYFEAEGIDGVRIYFCNECKHYLKAIDTRIRLTHDSETEDVLTLDMDGLAIQEGFIEAS